ncbi:acidic fibroblast growth factor intracellular-binding protein B-like isoform X2 [Dendronephthya gigantea]|uniref:acidic fibroblast growth factor intracellular-binding protein B-like isoform X2 n=1 Tax=Dendronephthya gigantea TaxID=151771 RepID=UPI001068E3F1|nr:acidic fibroblast growth factor intracellular-binding protein B-like isoform X2 [Dendronephthya gigantea]
MEEVDVFVTDPTTLDLEVYNLWLKGYSEQEAAEHQTKHGYLQQVGATPAIIASDIADQYRVFLVLEHFLQTPTLLATQLILQIPSDVQDRLIERYYEFDNIIVRDLLVEDSTGDLVKNIKTEFLLSEKLSKLYACIVFMSYHKFETGKRRLTYLTFADCAYCVDHMITNWMTSSSDITDSDTALDMDKNFLQELRDLKTFSSDKDIADEHKRAVFTELKTKASKEIAKTFDPHVKNLDRILINIGAGLIHQKDMKDIFLDLIEKFMEPCKQLKLTVNGLSTFLQALMSTCEKLSSVQKAGLLRLVPVYVRYLTVVHECIVRIYPKL